MLALISYKMLKSSFFIFLGLFSLCVSVHGGSFFSLEQKCQIFMDVADKMEQEKFLSNDDYLKSYTLCRDVLHLDDFDTIPTRRKNLPTKIGIDKTFDSRNLQYYFDGDGFCAIMLFESGFFKGKPTTLVKSSRFVSSKTVHSIKNIGNCCWTIYNNGSKWDVIRAQEEKAVLKHPLRPPFLFKKSTDCE